MAYPPSTPASDKTNDTLTRDDHAPHHNQLALAIGDMVTELGSDPKGPDADVTARLDRLDEESDPALVEAIQQGDADYLDRKLFAWRKALANAATTRAVILALGDSRVEGAGLDTIEERWLNLLQGHLRDRYNSLDTGRGYIPASYTAYMALDEDPTTSGTVAFRDTEGLGLRAMALSSTGPGTVTFELHGTDMILCYAGINGGGQSEYRVNGGGWATINHNNGAAGFDFREEQEFVYLGPEDDYTVEWRWKAQGTGIAPTPVIEGIIEINGDEAAAGSGSDFAGISVLDSGHAGATAADYINAASDHFLGQWVSDHDVTLAIIDLGTNEWQASEHATITSDVATYKANLESLIELLRTGNSDIEVILLGGWTPAGTLGTGSPDDWELFVAAQYEIAAADPMTSVFDMRRFLPEPYSGGDDSFYDFLAIHPTAAGHAAIASALADHLSLPTGGAHGTDEIAWHYVGDTGEPDFENGWDNFDGVALGFGTAGFDAPLRFGRKDNEVVIEGFVDGGSATGITIFTLPPGFRPDRFRLTMGFGADAGFASSGPVAINAANPINGPGALDGAAEYATNRRFQYVSVRFLVEG